MKTLSAALLLVAGLAFAVMGCKDKSEPTAPPSTAPPRAGDWKATTGFGEMVFTVNSTRTHINQIVFRWLQTGWTCGIVTYVGGSLTIRYGSGLPITDRQFSLFEGTLGPISENEKMTVTGTFNQAGNSASGTWSANMRGVICSGTWGPIGPM